MDNWIHEVVELQPVLAFLCRLVRIIMRVILNPLVVMTAVIDLIQIVLDGGIFTDVEYNLEG